MGRSGGWLVAALFFTVAGAFLFLGLQRHRQLEEEPVAQAAPPPVVQQARPAAAALPPRAPPRPASLAPAPPRALPVLSTYAWSEGRRGYQSAIGDQAASGCPMLLYFRTDWCPYCKQFDASVLTDAGVSSAIAPAAKVRINPESGPDEAALAKRFGVHGYPTLILVPEEGAAPVPLSPGVSRDHSVDANAFASAFRESVTYAWDASAIAELNSGRFDAAIEHADRLLAYQPSDPKGRASYLRAFAFQKKGDVPAALRDYRAACAAGCASCCNVAR